jgi:hypothetical protein
VKSETPDLTPGTRWHSAPDVPRLDCTSRAGTNSILSPEFGTMHASGELRVQGQEVSKEFFRWSAPLESGAECNSGIYQYAIPERLLVRCSTRADQSGATGFRVSRR